MSALANVGGPDLDDIRGAGIGIPPLGTYIPQIRFRTAQITLPERPAYGIRLDQVMRRHYVRSASEVRGLCGIPPSAALVLFCFAHDRVLERLWGDEEAFSAVAGGGWDLITAPSYSLWYRRPRPLHFHSIRRSFDVYAAFHHLGARAIPRVAFVDAIDADRQAIWCNTNDQVEMVSLDLMTCRHDGDWLENARLLAQFDSASGQRLRFLINGTTAFARLKYLFELLSDRVVVTDATAAPPPLDLADHLEDEPKEHLSNAEWRQRIVRRDSAISRARDRARGNGLIDAGQSDGRSPLGRRARSAA